MLKFFCVVFAVIVIFLGYVSSRKGEFHYERSGVIQAPAERIFPYLVNFRKGVEWNPYDRRDPQMKRAYGGVDGQIGSSLDFDGNKDVGAGRLELMQMTPNQRVEIRLSMTRPFSAQNRVIYTLEPDGSGTRFTWAMEGNGGFIGKLIGVFIDCEKMMSKDFDDGIQTLKSLVESQKH